MSELEAGQVGRSMKIYLAGVGGDWWIVKKINLSY